MAEPDMTERLQPARDCDVAAEQPGQQTGRGTRDWLGRFGWLLPIAAALAVYGVGFDNFFSYDDFIWLNRARTLTRDWTQILRPDVTYFDPVVHLLFFLDWRLAGVDHRWYHGVDLAIHAANALLLYRLALMLSGDRRGALYAALFFAGAFAIADAVLWPSSRVDLTATFFSLAALICFLDFLRSENRGRFWLAFLLFLLALCCKGTPLVLPAVLLWLMLQEGQPWRRVGLLLPYAGAALLFLLLLKLNMQHASLPLDRFHFSIRNLLLSFAALFMPESVLKGLNLSLVASGLLLGVGAAVLPRLSGAPTLALRRTGFALLVALLPVLVITELKLVDEYSNPSQLLVSPSHRIYLAATGAALICGGLLRELELLLERRAARLAGPLVLLALALVLGADLYLVRERDAAWEKIADPSRNAFEGLRRYRGQVPEGSQLGLIYFPGSLGFQTPLAKVSLEVDDLTLLKVVTLGFIEDQEVLRKAERSFLFVMSSDGKVRDHSRLFRQQLLLNRMALFFPDRPQLFMDCKAIADRLNREIE